MQNFKIRTCLANLHYGPKNVGHSTMLRVFVIRYKTIVAFKKRRHDDLLANLLFFLFYYACPKITYVKNTMLLFYFAKEIEALAWRPGFVCCAKRISARRLDAEVEIML